MRQAPAVLAGVVLAALNRLALLVEQVVMERQTLVVGQVVVAQRRAKALGAQAAPVSSS
jgi:hypothetical protein